MGSWADRIPREQYPQHSWQEMGGGVTSEVEHENRAMATTKLEGETKPKADPKGGTMSSMKPGGSKALNEA